ncbi:MAG: K(+)-transporting ATPase subunit C [Bacillota bacterium]|nr:K(+)-transporting ATPase subunit C [Bacillota bacterium]
MKELLKSLKPALYCFIIMTILCGVIYTGVITGVAQLLFPNKANGSVITVTLKDGSHKDYGSALIAQKFTKPEYLIGRPMGVTNLSAVSKKQAALVKERIKWWHDLDPDNKADIPMDLVTASGSGVDPNISPAAAEYQVSRIAKQRGMSENDVRSVIARYTSQKLLGFIGEPAVNVLKVNLALDKLI